LKFEEIRNIINKRIDEFFKNCEEIETHIEDAKLKNDSDYSNHVNKTLPEANCNWNNSIDKNLIEKINPLDQIFKKILLENNSMYHSNPKIHKYSDIHIPSNFNTTNPLSYHEKLPNLGRARVIIFSDMTNDSLFDFNQKYLFLMKRQDIHIDCLSVGNNQIIVISNFDKNFRTNYNQLLFILGDYTTTLQI